MAKNLKDKAKGLVFGAMKERELAERLKEDENEVKGPGQSHEEVTQDLSAVLVLDM